jgi:hypothetical protein
VSKCDLKIDWATHDAARYACEHWHYSRCLPPSKTAKFGVWENGKFVGAVVYGVGATSSLVKQYGLQMQEGCELIRIAMCHHQTPVSKIVAISLRILKKTFPGLRLVVSFADPEQGHHGGIYQAGGWIFNGNSQSSDEYIYLGKRWQGRAFRHKYKGMEKHPSVQIVRGSSKHRYLMPLDSEMRKKILPLARPYPKRAGSDTKDTPGFHPGEGGSTPTPALHSQAA